MQAVLTRDDMATSRNFLRWVGVGVYPSKQYTEAVSEVIKPLNPESVSLVRRVVDEINRGVLASQQVCNDAQQQLLTVFNTNQDIDVEKGEVDRG